MFNPETFRDYALARFQESARRKYDKGQKEHGDYIVDRVELRDLEEEIMDLWFYVQALRIKLGRSSSETTMGAIMQTNAHNDGHKVQQFTPGSKKPLTGAGDK